MRRELEQFFSSPAYAVVGASANREKWGNIAYRMLLEKGFPIYPVNPHHATLEGDRCYPNVYALPDQVQSVVLVVPPQVGEQVVHDCVTRGMRGIWMQPGAESPRALAEAHEHGIAVISDACIMVMLAPVKHYHELPSWLARAVTFYP